MDLLPGLFFFMAEMERREIELGVVGAGSSPGRKTKRECEQGRKKERKTRKRSGCDTDRNRDY